MSIAEAGEFGLIARITARLRDRRRRACSARVTTPRSWPRPTAGWWRRTDVLVEGRHFRRDWSSATRRRAPGGRGQPGRHRRDGRHADRAAGGAVRAAGPGRRAGPRSWPTGWPPRRRLVGASVVGGDMSASPTLTIAVTALGDLGGRPPVVRGGRPARRRGRAGRPDRVRGGRLHRAVPGLPHARSCWSRRTGGPRCRTRPVRRPPGLGATSMIDVSDGLLADLGHIAAASGVGDRRPPGRVRGARRRCGTRRRRSASTRTTGCWPAATTTRWPRPSRPDAELPPGWRVVGKVHEGTGVTVDGKPWQGGTGWDHFR